MTDDTTFRPAPPPASAPANWPVGGGETGELVRRFDWSATTLGPIAAWPQNLRIKVNSMVNSPIPQVLMWGPDHVMIYNDGYIEIAGGNHPRALGGRVPEVWPEIWDWNRGILAEGFAGRVQQFREQTLVLHRNGQPEPVIFDLYYTPIYSDDGLRVEGVLCTVLDITAAVRARDDLAASRAELRGLTDALPILVGFLDTSLTYRLANARYVDIFGRRGEDVEGHSAREILGEQIFARREPLLRRALAGENVVTDSAFVLPDGTPRTFEVRYSPRRDCSGQVDGLYVLMIDIEDRMRTELQLRHSNERFRAAVDAIHGILWTNGPDGRMTGEQPGWQALTGQTAGEYAGYGWADAVHPNDRPGSIASWQQAVAARRTYVWEHRVRRFDGVWRNCAIRAVPTFDANGEIREWVGVHTDITDQRAAEAELVRRAHDLERQVRHRENAEEQLRLVNEGLEERIAAEIESHRKTERALRQSQKMEAIGQLTGGIAHDFNNLLQVVSGNLHLLGREVAGNERAQERVTHALAGVQRGARLASQLLAFGRRQALEPRVLHLGRLVSGMDDLLRRSLGEGVEIEVVTAGRLWNTLADPSQVENVLLNLAINARDAMAGQGKLTIEVGNAHLDHAYAAANADVDPGQYVMLAVTDTGHGMTPEVLEKVFEPFFSTKPEGKGTGLGLSMVYGFVKQSGGHVAIYSEPGHGTTVKVFLPRSMAAEDREAAAPGGPVTGGTETVLVVEDDDAVRATAVDLLTDLGYRVLTARDPHAGLAVLESGARIDVLFTDVVMPGTLTSRELARRAQARDPSIAILFTSGYTENSIVHGGRLDPGVELLSKPYTQEALARRIRHVLATRPGGVAPPEGAAPVLPAATGPAAPPAQAGRAAAPAQAGRAPLSVPGAQEADAPPGPARILLVEDDGLIRMDTALFLTDMGHTVTEAGLAREALSALDTGAFDLLLTDLGLPDMPGAELARRILDRCPGLGLVYATGETALPPGSPPQAVLLCKPYGEEDLRIAVDTAMTRRPAG